MPRFFFNVRGGKDFPDAEGVEFADASAACDWQLDITDAAGKRVGSLRFSVTRP